jgi:urease subunit gamma/beta
MPLTPGEDDRLLLHVQAGLAQRRRDRGLRLNVPEARALIADAVCEWARDGLDLPATVHRAHHLLGPEDVLPGVPQALSEIRVEARFDDGTRLVVVKDPFGQPAAGDRAAPCPPAGPEEPERRSIRVRNEARTAIGLTSHVHLAEVNPRLRLDRRAAFGMRPAVSTGETVWIGPGEQVDLPVRPIGGARVAIGTSGVVDGPLDDPGVRERALSTLRECGYLDLVDGVPVNDPRGAEGAVSRLVADASGSRTRP